MAELGNDFVRKATDAFLDVAEHELVGKQGNRGKEKGTKHPDDDIPI